MNGNHGSKGEGMTRYFLMPLEKNIAGMNSVITLALFVAEGGLTLFDAGYPGQLPEIEAGLGDLGFTLSEVRRVVLSHQDHDHVGSLAALKAAHPSLEVCCSAVEAPYISGERKSPRLAQAEAFNRHLKGEQAAFGERFAAYLRTIEACPVDRLLSDGEEIEAGLRVLFTPGHTPGHLSLHLEEGGIVFAGDALAYEGGVLGLANPQFTLDLPGATASIGRIAELEPSELVCYHGGVVAGDLRARLASLA